MPILEVNGLSKKYKNNNFYSLKDATFSINKGEIVGLVGKNGAGKSTLLKMMAKAQKPTEGIIKYKNQDINKSNNILNDFGLMIEPVFYNNLTVEENLKFYIKIHKKEKNLGNINEVLKLVDLLESKNRYPRDFSFGMKQRTALAIALVTNPSFVILDEPFVGLDPVGVKKLLNILKRWAENRKVTMIISSHQLNELESICDRYIFIENGYLQENINQQKSILEITINNNKQEFLDSLIKQFNLKCINNVIKIPNSINNDELNKILNELSSHQMINKIKDVSNNLNDLFEE